VVDTEVGQFLLELETEHLADLVVEEEHPIQRVLLVDQEILHQSHHHKEILEEPVDLLETGVAPAVAVLVDLVETQVPLHLTLVLVVLV
jgi:hypothetical protein